MASTLSCGPCLVGRKQTIAALVWCPTCSEGLCKVCLDYHKSSRLSRSHDVIDAKKYTAFPSFMFKIKQDCSIHDKAFELYCPNHLVPCCEKCVSTDHSSCTGITSLTSAARDFRSSSHCRNFEKSIEDISTDLFNLKKNRTDNIKKFKNQKSDLESTLTKLKNKMNKQFDQLEMDLLREFSNTQSRETGRINGMMRRLESKEQSVYKIRTGWEGAKTQLPETQLFLGQHELEKQLAEKREEMHTILEEDGMKEVKISHNLDDEILISLGSITTSYENCNASLTDLPNQQAQFVLAETTNMVHVTAIRNISIQGSPLISDILIIGNDRIVISDCSSYNGLLLIPGKTSDLRELRVPGKPWGLALHDRYTFAASYPEEKAIKFIHKSNFSVVKTFQLEKKVTGLSSIDGLLVAGLGKDEIWLLNTNGRTVKKISSLPVSPEYIHAKSGKIYCSNTQSNIVYCFDREGKTIWSLNSFILKKPRGICSDNEGNIFLAGEKSNNIIAISSPYDNMKEIRSEVLSASAVCCENKVMYIYDENNGSILVCKVQNK